MLSLNPPFCQKIWYMMMTNLLPPANEVWSKVIISQACVSHSVHVEGEGAVLSRDIILSRRCHEGMCHVGGAVKGGANKSSAVKGTPLPVGQQESYWNAFLLCTYNYFVICQSHRSPNCMI